MTSVGTTKFECFFLHFGWNFENLVRQARETVEMQEIKLIWFNYTSSLSLDLYLMHTAHEFESIQYTEYCKIYVMCIQFVIELECLNLNWGLQHWRHITWILIRLSTVAQTAHTVWERGSSHTVVQRMPSIQLFQQKWIF